MQLEVSKWDRHEHQMYHDADKSVQNDCCDYCFYSASLVEVLDELSDILFPVESHETTKNVSSVKWNAFYES